MRNQDDVDSLSVSLSQSTRKVSVLVGHPSKVTTVHHISPIVPIGRTMGGGPRVVVSTAAIHARVRGSVPGLGGLKETKMFLPHPRVKLSIVGSLRDREVRARPQTANARISSPVSGGQCRLIHLTILRRFSWPSLAYMCTKVA